MNAAEAFRDQVPDQHTCRLCHRTKHDDDEVYGKVNFRCSPGSSKPRRVCYPCEVAQKRNRDMAQRGDERHVTPIPPGHTIKGVSTMLDSKGQPTSQWIKTVATEEDRARMLLEEFVVMGESWRGCVEDPGMPQYSDEDLLAVYPMGDPHIGMYAWADEAGDDFDLEIAERNLVNAVDRLSALAPPARHGLVISLGDFFHADNPENRTTRSGNALDVDTRWPKVIRTGIRAMIRCIDLALEKHDTVSVICELGNHDDNSSLLLALALELRYENVDRVRVDVSPDRFHWFRFGKCLLGTTHGDKRLSAPDLESIMANDRREDWGETLFRYWYVGHIHHQTVKETRGCTVESFNTLAASDAFHRHGGYRARRNMKLLILHKEFGEINRHQVGIEQLAPSGNVSQSSDPPSSGSSTSTESTEG